MKNRKAKTFDFMWRLLCKDKKQGGESAENETGVKFKKESYTNQEKVPNTHSYSPHHR